MKTADTGHGNIAIQVFAMQGKRKSQITIISVFN
jgi:hypothetical protein